MMILMTILWFYSHVTVSLALALIGGLPRPGPTWHSNFAASTRVAFDTCQYSHTNELMKEQKNYSYKKRKELQLFLFGININSFAIPKFTLS